MDCPVYLPKVFRMCEACQYGKDGKCDYPYYRGMSEEEIQRVTERQKKENEN